MPSKKAGDIEQRLRELEPRVESAVRNFVSSFDEMIQVVRMALECANAFVNALPPGEEKDEAIAEVARLKATYADLASAKAGIPSLPLQSTQ